MGSSNLLTGKVLWCYDNELQQANLADEFRGMMSFTMPLHYHVGEITLTDNSIVINGDADLRIPLDNLQQLYMGFDDQYRRTFAKNGGLFWQPLKLSYADNAQMRSVYLIIDLDWFSVKNKLWFETLKAMFNEES
ncbi:hypothetical protein ACFQ3S_11910 [Mucilaginibacter terrae]|uniref:hypothetical protein n=1 Tax=Mucilaginibacter terrae TaxID=1955052 RepID=UPI003627E797